MLNIKQAAPCEYKAALSLMKGNMEAEMTSRGLSWDEEWIKNNYQGKDNYSIFRAGVWIGFLSIELAPNSLFVHTLQLIPEAQGSTNGYGVYEWIKAKAASVGRQRIDCKAFIGSSASAIYLRLGFKVVGTDNQLCQMQLNLKS